MPDFLNYSCPLHHRCVNNLKCFLNFFIEFEPQNVFSLMDYLVLMVFLAFGLI